MDACLIILPIALKKLRVTFRRIVMFPPSRQVLSLWSTVSQLRISKKLQIKLQELSYLNFVDFPLLLWQKGTKGLSVKANGPKSSFMLSP